MDDISVYFSELGNESLDARHAAVDKIAAAGRQRPERIVPIVIAELRNADVDTRWYLGRSLIYMGPGIIPVLLEYSEMEQDMDIQKYFGAVLAAFGETAVPFLVGVFGSQNPTTRGMASAALERIGQPAVPALVEAASGDDPQIKICAELTLNRLNVFEY